MFDSLLRRLTQANPARLPEPDAQLALAALLVRIARADDDYSTTETARIDRTLASQFHLSPFAASALRDQAEALEKTAPDTVRFTRALKGAVALEDRMGLLQAMWTIALADGLRDEEEDRLLRLVANLLGLTDVESALARQKAERP
ncbi:MAG: TerB family tellurite resistance protein [Paracoccaceae bacterium]